MTRLKLTFILATIGMSKVNDEKIHFIISGWKELKIGYKVLTCNLFVRYCDHLVLVLQLETIYALLLLLIITVECIITIIIIIIVVVISISITVNPVFKSTYIAEKTNISDPIKGNEEAISLH